MRDEVGLLLEHDADRDAGESLTAGRQFRQRLAISAAEISFVDQPSVPDHEQSAMLAGLLHVFKGVVELAGVDARHLANFGRIVEISPAAFGVRGRIEVLSGKGREGG